MSWRDRIPDLLTTRAFRTQGEIVRALAGGGDHVDQAAVSRELRWVGATKVDGVYRMPTTTFEHPIGRFVSTAGGCLVVVVTEPAWAMALAQRIDDASLDGVLGTVAGDDTVFVATTGARATEQLGRWLGVAPSA